MSIYLTTQVYLAFDRYRLMVKWFVMRDERVTGPFNSDEIRAKITDGQIDTSSLIWGRPQSAWQDLSWWLKESSQLAESLQNEISEQKWHFAIDGDSKGPFTRVELVNEIKAIRNKTEILVWTKGMKAWADLYEFHDLLDEIGMNKREHPRASISGSAVIRYDDKTLVGVLKTISSGGFGAAQLNSLLPLGQIVNVELKSDLLNEQLNVKATVQYSSETGYYGFKFTGINMETKALIMEYIRTSKKSIELAA